MKFWDSSALLPLIVPELRTGECLHLAQTDPEIAYWWGTPIEIASALARRNREGILLASDMAAARRQMNLMLQACTEVTPSEQVRNLTFQLLRQHPLRAADSTQLAAAMVLFGTSSAVIEFVCLDDRLRAAALAEGVSVYP